MARSLAPVIVTALVLLTLAGCTRHSQEADLLKQADASYSAANYEEAKIEYLNVLRLDPQNALAIRRMGLIWYNQGAPLHALPYLKQSIATAGQDLDLQVKLALSYAWLGAVAEARTEALSILHQSPDSPEALRVLDDTTRSPEQIAETAKYLAQVTDKNSDSYEVAAGGLSLKKGDFTTAEGDARRALQINPDSSEAYLLLATLYQLQGKGSDAGAQLKKAADLAPIRSLVRIQYAEFEAQHDSLDAAEAVLKTVTTQAPDYIPAWILAGKIAISRQRYDDAAAVAGKILHEDPVNLDASLLQCQVWVATGKVKQAIEALQKLDQSFPGVSSIKYQLALAHLQDKDPAQAAINLAQTVSLNPNNLDATLLLAELNLRKGDAASVVPVMSSLHALRPDLAPAGALLTEAYLALDRLDDAAAVATEEIQRAPADPDFYLLLGATLHRQGHLDQARQIIQRGQALAPDDIRFVNQLVNFDLTENHLDDALDRAQAQVAKTPQAAPAWFLKARVAIARKKWDDAEAALLKTLELDPNFAGGYDLLVSVYIAENKLDAALDRLQTILASAPDNSQALVMAALIHEKKGEYEKARDAYEKLIAAEPNFAPALNNLACLYADRFNQLDKAYDLARKARALQPADPAIADTLGWILYRRKEYEQAFALLQEAAGKLPGNPEIQFHLGMAGYMMNETGIAAAALDQAASAPLDPPAREEAQRRLTLLQTGTISGVQPPDALESVVAQHSDDVVAWIRLGTAWENQNEFAKAADAYRSALAVNPRLLSPLLSLARLYDGPLQDKQKALTVAKEARDLAPDDAATGALLGRIAYDAGEFQWAYSLLQTASVRLADDPGVLHDFAWAAYSLGKLDEANQAMRRVLELAAGSPLAQDAKSFLTMTDLDGNSKDLDAAQPKVQAVLAAVPDYVPALMAQAAIDLRHGDSQQAAGIYNQVLRQFPQFAPARELLASLTRPSH